MTGDGKHEALEPVMVEAMDWLLRLTSGAATTDDARALAAWRAGNPAHDAAFREIAALRRMAQALPAEAVPEASANVVPIGVRRGSVTRRGLFGGAAIAASVAGAVLLTRPPLGLWPSLAELTADHRTGAGERYAFDPAAGVRVEMNSRTSVSLTGGGIALVSGEAFVTVDDRSHPFEVAAGDMRITAHRASFNVRAVDGIVRVACVGGTVSCERGGAVSTLGVGDQLGYAGDGAAQRSTIDPATALAWRRGLLIFDGTALSDVIAEINRYRAGNIVLADAALGNRPVNGIFHTAQIDNTVAQIQRLLAVRVRHLPGGVVLLG